MEDKEVLLRLRRLYSKDEVVRLLKVENGGLVAEVHHLESIVAKQKETITTLEKKLAEKPTMQQFKK